LYLFKFQESLALTEMLLSWLNDSWITRLMVQHTALQRQGVRWPLMPDCDVIISWLKNIKLLSGQYWDYYSQGRGEKRLIYLRQVMCS